MAKAKRVKGINCNAPAGEGIKLVLQTRFEEMYGLPEAAMNWEDPEGVHSMRVASRRLRSALRDFTPYLRKSGLRTSQKEVRNLAGALGEVRDQDVALMALEQTAAKAPKEAATAVKYFISLREEVRAEARTKLQAALRNDDLQGLRRDFLASVEKATAPPKNPTNNVTYLKMARAVIVGRLRELEKLSDSLYRPFAVDPLHDMRIAAKRLRYAIELFQSCWGRSMKTYAKRVARLQTALGGLHDCDVWVEHIGEEMLKANKLKQSEHVKGSEWLLHHFLRQRARYLRQASGLWRKWEADEVSTKLRETVHAEVPVRKSAEETSSEAESTAEAVKVQTAVQSQT